VELKKRLIIFQRQTVRVHLPLGRNFADRPTAHDPEPGLPRDQLHATEGVAGAPDQRGAQLVPGADQALGHLPVRSQ